LDWASARVFDGTRRSLRCATPSRIEEKERKEKERKKKRKGKRKEKEKNRIEFIFHRSFSELCHDTGVKLISHINGILVTTVS
jgi:hypothetical protein